MNPLYSCLMKNLSLSFAILFLSSGQLLKAQACSTAQGDQTTYGTNNVWIGYAYTGTNFANYQGYVTEGASSSPNFDESFGGNQVNYPTNGCSVYTEGFSMRYKLTQSLTGNYTITVGADDGYRLSLDGGSTWAINNWNDHAYTTTAITVNLSGATNLILEYYENGGGNRVSFNIVQNCSGTGNPAIYGTNNVWMGYLYQGTNFDTYKGSVTEGSSMNPNFDENFGTPNGPYYTSSCSVITEQFSARYRLQDNLAAATYIITIGGDDGYRFSLDGGSTWVINKWNDQGYNVTTYTASLSGTQNMVLEYYENGGDNRVSFSMSSSLLPVTITSWSATALSDQQTLLKWTAANAINFDHYVIGRSTDGQSFQDAGRIVTSIASGTAQDYSFTDVFPYDGTVYYRLEMVDKDGTVNYSNIISIVRQGARTARIYPTIVENNSLFVETPAFIPRARLEIFDMNGRKLQEKDWSMLEGRTQVTIGNGGTLPAGAYLARLSDGQSTIAKQIILVK
ncbi:MAG TPA: T9SS type A sorting domain-containing protein [Puia sp.]|nr:T9SS type A sorting domain-containing protein [Puia sp.]